MIELVRTDSKNQNFINLVKLLDADLTIRDGDIPIGCGAIKKFDVNSVEVKRMFVLPTSRGKGISSKLLVEIENWASELFFKRCILETGKKQPEAITLYKKSGYQITGNYGQYTSIKNSICFEKKLK